MDGRSRRLHHPWLLQPHAQAARLRFRQPVQPGTAGGRQRRAAAGRPRLLAHRDRRFSGQRRQCPAKRQPGQPGRPAGRLPPAAGPARSGPGRAAAKRAPLAHAHRPAGGHGAAGAATAGHRAAGLPGMGARRLRQQMAQRQQLPDQQPAGHAADPAALRPWRTAERQGLRDAGEVFPRRHEAD